MMELENASMKTFLRIQNLVNITLQGNSFLNVDEDFYAFYCLITVLKCIIAGYGAKKLIRGSVTFLMLWVHFIYSSVRNKDLYDVLLNIIHFGGTTSTQLYFRNEKHPFICSVVSWGIAAVDTKFHFFLDVYVLVTLYTIILKAYRKRYDSAFLLLSYLFVVDWFCDKFIERRDWFERLADLYFPVFLFASLLPVKEQCIRILCIQVSIFSWLLYKLFKAGLIDWKKMLKIHADTAAYFYLDPEV